MNYLFYAYCHNVVSAWSGAIADTTRNRIIIWGGGHGDYYGNEIYSLNLDANPPTVTRLTDPSPINVISGSCVATLADGKPNSRHTYNNLAYIASADRLFAFSGGVACGGGAPQYDTWTLDLANTSSGGLGGWRRMDPVNGKPQPNNYYGSPGNNVVYDPNTGLVFVDNLGGIFKYNYSTNTYTQLALGNLAYESTGALDTTRKLWIFVGTDNNNNVRVPTVKVIDLSPGSNYVVQDWTNQVTGCGPLAGAQYPGVTYDSAIDRIVGWPSTGNTIYLFNPDTKACTAQTFPGGPVNPTLLGNGSGSTFGRFQYFPVLDLFAVVFDANSDAYILKLAASPAPAPVIRGIGNAASYDTVGFAGGSFITIFGGNFGTTAQAPAPYPTGLGDVSGVDIAPISGGAAVPALLYFTSSGQINAILPSQVPLGDANVTVTVHGQTSAPFKISVLQNHFGIFSVGQDGKGQAIVQNYVSPLSTPLNTFTNPAEDGTTLIIWGTGAGPVPNDNDPKPGNVIPLDNVSVQIGTLSLRPFYVGRSSYPGEDQVNVTIPKNSGIVDSCYVPLMVEIGDQISNVVTIAMAPKGQSTCTQPLAVSVNELEESRQQQFGNGDRRALKPVEYFDHTGSIPLWLKLKQL